MDFAISLGIISCIMVILALSLNLISGYCGQISLGHAAFYGIGAYGAAMATKAGVPFVAALIGGGLLAGVFGILVGFAALRVREDFLAITTMGVGFLFVGIVRQQSWLGGEMGLFGIPDPGFSRGEYLAFVAFLAVLTI
ncbi:MAG: branched-chain amino acid ABC transporter permease, partial [Fimbriimonadaceae bacterium]|nr:branched-chain amino acid ABC transporter permease [Alphaproteobacteria bacterium]